MQVSLSLFAYLYAYQNILFTNTKLFEYLRFYLTILPKWYISTYWYVGSIGVWIFSTQSGKPDTLVNSSGINSNETGILSTMAAGCSLLWICADPGRHFL